VTYFYVHSVGSNGPKIHGTRNGYIVVVVAAAAAVIVVDYRVGQNSNPQILYT